MLHKFVGANVESPESLFRHVSLWPCSTFISSCAILFWGTTFEILQGANVECDQYVGPTSQECAGFRSLNIIAILTSFYHLGVSIYFRLGFRILQFSCFLS